MRVQVAQTVPASSHGVAHGGLGKQRPNLSDRVVSPLHTVVLLWVECREMGLSISLSLYLYVIYCDVVSCFYHGFLSFHHGFLGAEVRCSEGLYRYQK